MEMDLEVLGLAQGRLGTRKWGQHETDLSQVGANLGLTCAQPEPTWSQLGPKLDPVSQPEEILRLC